jgi:hypothetical protein
MKFSMLCVVAMLSAGCFGKVAEEGTGPLGGGGALPEPSASTPGATVPVPATPDTPTGNGDRPGTCWQSSPNVPKATGPSGTLTSCSLVGTWSYEVTFSHPQQYKMVWAFDDQGRAVGGPAGTNLCDGFAWRGNYELGSDGSFAAIDIRGDGAPTCGHDGETTFGTAFSPDCKTFLVQRGVTDACTGGSLFYVGKMTKIE